MPELKLEVSPILLPGVPHYQISKSVWVVSPLRICLKMSLFAFTVKWSFIWVQINCYYLITLNDIFYYFLAPEKKKCCQSKSYIFSLVAFITLFVSDILQFHYPFAKMYIYFYLTCWDLVMLLQSNAPCLTTVLFYTFFSQYFFKYCLTSIFPIYSSRATTRYSLDLLVKLWFICNPLFKTSQLLRLLACIPSNFLSSVSQITNFLLSCVLPGI